jgi:NADPH:quinone reductase-like Zn-dependent oxidoreductase
MTASQNDQHDVQSPVSGRALRLQAYGGADSLRVDFVPAPVPGPNQVVVQVKAAGVNGIDWKVRQGFLREKFNLTLPSTLGIEMSGVVLQVGTNVTTAQVGDRVMAALGGLGAYADHLLIGAEKLVKTPAGLTDVQAAAVPVAAMTAWQILRAPGLDLIDKRLLIHGAAGGVGSFAVQFAKAAGATVFATASTRSVAHVNDLGADTVIDYQQQDFEHAVRDIDLVVDLAGGQVVDKSWQTMAPDGVLVSIATTDVVARTPEGRRGLWFSMKTDTSQLAAIAQQIADGSVRLTLGEVVSFEELPAAIERNRTGHAPGKAVADFTR